MKLKAKPAKPVRETKKEWEVTLRELVEEHGLDAVVREFDNYDDCSGYEILKYESDVEWQKRVDKYNFDMEKYEKWKKENKEEIKIEKAKRKEEAAERKKINDEIKRLRKLL